MKCDIVFSCLKRFKFEKSKKNEFGPDYGKIGRTQWLKIRNLKSICVCVKKNQNFPILLLERQRFRPSKTGRNLSWTLVKKRILKCLKIAFAYSSDYPSFKVKFGKIFWHVPWLQIPSNLVRVNIFWWSKTWIKISLGSSSSGFWGATF